MAKPSNRSTSEILTLPVSSIRSIHE